MNNNNSASILSEDDFSCVYKIVMIGDSSVGKTHILQRYVKGVLPKYQSPTIGIEYATKTVNLGKGLKVKTSIWDTAGQERYRAITSSYNCLLCEQLDKKAEGALVVFDVTQEKTFQSVARWIEELQAQAEPNVVIMLIGNKIDLCEKNPEMRKVTKEQAKSLAKEYNGLYEETSAITAQNINEAFEKLLREICNRKGNYELYASEKSTKLVSMGHEEVKKNDSSCCSK